MKTLNRIVMSFTLGFGLSALAQSQTPGPHGQSWQSLVQSLQRQGITRVGALDLERFSRDAQQIKWNNTPENVPSLIAGARTSAYYLIQKKEVYIGSQIRFESNAARADLEMHEALGALGYEDEHYALSTALRLLEQTRDKAARAQLQKLYGSTLFSNETIRIRRGGHSNPLLRDGGSSVGGGGDIRAMLIKNAVLTKILSENPNPSAEFLLRFPLLGFEALRTGHADQVSINFQFRSRDAIASTGTINRVLVQNGIQEHITFYIPVELWHQSPIVKQRLIQDLVNKVLGFFPASPGPTMEIKICGTQRARIPVTRDRDVYDIQVYRMGMLTGCDPISRYANSMTSPKIPVAAEPARAGIHRFACTFRRDDKTATHDLAIADGRAVTHSLSLEPQDGVRISGLVQFSDQGALTRMFFSRYENGRSHFTTPQNIPLLGPARITYPLNGRPLHLTCVRK